jgi:hypothetical protein
MALFSVPRGGTRARRLHAALQATPSWLAFQLASLLVFLVMMAIGLPLYLRVYRPSVEWEQGIELDGFTGAPQEEALLPKAYDAPLEDRIEVRGQSQLPSTRDAANTQLAWSRVPGAAQLQRQPRLGRASGRTQHPHHAR